MSSGLIGADYYIPLVMESDTLPVAKGRPREFCVDQALAEALRVFWAKGYDGASMADLTEAMGITKPSLYAAFGNKEALFHKALDLYESEKLDYTRAALEQPTARAVAEYYLRGALDRHCGAEDPKGCMGLLGTLACSPEADSIKADVVRRRASSQRALVDRFARAKAEGDLPDHIDPEGLTGHMLAILQGLTVQASAGAPRADLERLVETSLALWPSK